MAKSIIIKNISELNDTANQILNFAKDKDNKIFCFYGELGAGKTTLIKTICNILGVKDSTGSPTFSLINEYQTKTGKKIFHIDLYRIKTETEIFDLGYEDYLFSGNYCFIEWAEKIEHLLPEDCVRVKIEVETEKRIINIF
ncbi:MAG: tRNA (adenosine(37)-N6)-threonylcarbamoyltransferase complex ATPase subunit type 1 TsaE [Bacteroidota bacterium]